MKKNRFINILLTMIMLLSTIMTPQLAHNVSANLDDDDNVEDVEPEESDEGPEDEGLQDVSDTDNPDGDDAEAAEVEGEEEQDLKDKEDSAATNEVENTDKTPADININDPPAEEEVAEEEELSTLNISPQREIEKDEIIFSNIRFTDTAGDEFSADNPYDLDKAEAGQLHLDWALPEGHKVTGGDTYTFNLPAQFTPTNATSGELGDVGKWSVTGDGTVTFTFNENVDGDDVKGDFWFEIELVEDELENTVEQQINFPIGPEDYTVDFLLRPKGGELIDKRGTINNGGFNSNEAYWEIDINTGLETLVDASVTDKIPTNMVLQADSVVVYKLGVDIYGNRTQGDPLDPSKYSVTSDGDGNPVISFDRLTEDEVNQAYRIVYTTDIVEPDEGFDGRQHFTNNAVLKNNDSELNASATVNSGYGQAIAKGDPEYDSDEQTFDWIIDYNYNQKYIDKDQATIEDTWTPTGAMELENLEIYPVEISSTGVATVGTEPIDADSYIMTPKADNSGFDLSFTEDIDGQAYQIQYQTKILGQNGTGVVDKDGNVTNTVETGTGKTNGSKGTWYQQGIIKRHSGTDVNTKEIDWTIQLNQNSYLMENLVLEDTFSGDGLTLIENAENHSGYELRIMDGDQEFTGYNIVYTHQI